MKRLLSLVLCLNAIAWVGGREANAQSVEALMSSFQPRPGGTGFSVAIVRDGRTQYLGSQGNPAPPADARYVIASVTKEFTGAAILALEEDGHLRLTDPASKFLTDFPRWNQISIGDLLYNRTTLPDYTTTMPYTGGAPFQSDISLQALLGLIARKATTPYATYCLRYSSSNYAALTAIIEAASGRSYGSYLRTKIFEPLAMTRTGYTGGPLGSDVMQGHWPNGAATGTYHSSWGNGAGGLVTTASDMAKWNIAVMDGFLNIVKRVRRDVVTGPCHPRGFPPSYAYGWTMGPGGTLEHAGGLEGYASYNLVDPDRRAAATVLSNFAGHVDGVTSFARSLAKAPVDTAPAR
jgi:D-alanyl-D-alanine carboxypeptidase